MFGLPRSGSILLTVINQNSKLHASTTLLKYYSKCNNLEFWKKQTTKKYSIFGL